MEALKRTAGDVIFGVGFGLTCLLLVPVCVLLICVYGVFTSAAACRGRLGAGACGRIGE